MEAPGPGWALRAIIVMVITAIFFRCVAATNHSVGGDSGWDLNSNILAWSAATTVQVGDYLVFNYLPVHDVLEVNRTDFSNCHTVNPIRTHRDGETVIHLNQPGTRYFMCGRLQHCLKGLKLRVQVLQRLSDANNNSTDDGGANHEDPLKPRPRPPPPSPPSPPPSHPPPPPSSEGTPPPPPPSSEGTPPPPCICSGVGELMIKSGRQMNWLVLFLITLATLPCYHPLMA